MFDALWMLVAFFPLLGVLVILSVSFLLRRDCSAFVVALVLILEIVSFVVIYFLTRPIEGNYLVALSALPFSIQFHFSQEKIFFMANLFIPMAFALFRLKSLDSINVRLVFLFFLAGSIGLLVTGDIFNFFVFYELMIMAAYVLIGLKGNYGASIKYMLTGGISSLFFLAGIIVLYAGGAGMGFGYDPSHEIIARPWLDLGLLLCAIAFAIKAALFPASGWVASCHGATNSLVSSFLASFTVFSGIRGFYIFVLVPAERAGMMEFFELLRYLSLATMIVGALCMFFETDLKRTIAHNTLVTVGLVGLMCSFKNYDLAFLYMPIHALHKSIMFYSYEDLSQRGGRYLVRRLSLPIIGLAIFSMAGLFASPVYFLKQAFLSGQSVYKVLLFGMSFFVVAAFAKHRLGLRKALGKRFWPVLAVLVFGALYLMLFGHSLLANPGLSLLDLAIDLLVIAAAILVGRYLWPKLSFLHNFDRRLLFANLNRELFMLILLPITMTVFIVFKRGLL